MHFKKLRVDSYELIMLALVLSATLLRFILICLNWPFTNSDEATMDLMALHIAYHGEHPIFYYGQLYMGPLEAYIGAVLFRIFGVSVLTLRLGLLPFFALFLVCMYYLTRMLYTKKLALATVGLLSLGSSGIIRHQLLAIGGYPEIVLFGALIFLLAAWLAFSSPGKGNRTAEGRTTGDWATMHRATTRVAPTIHAAGETVYRRGDPRGRPVPRGHPVHGRPIRGRPIPARRQLIYALLGFVIGLALWIDQLILPIVAVSLLLLLFCYREALWGGLCLVAGMIIGAFPLIIYNISAPPGEDSLTVLLYLSRTGADKVVAEHISRAQQLLGTFLMSLPIATGVNPCHRGNDLPLLKSPTDSLSCITLQATWATGLTLLWGIAVLLACIAIWHQWPRIPAQEQSFEKRKRVIQHSARLLLLGSAALTFVLFARSPAAALYPVTSSRYLICLLLATPAVLWPLWRGLHRLDSLQVRRTQVMLIGRVGILLLIGTTFLVGTINTFGDIPQTQVAYTKEDALIQDLLHLGATRIYSEYWTCNRLIFASDERIICASLDEKLRQDFDRYLPYRAIVEADPHATYVFPLGSPQAIAFAELHQNNTQYRRYVFEGYVVYQREAERVRIGTLFAPQVYTNWQVSAIMCK